MAKICLHIGTHKTGTTMIQNRFHANRLALEARGVIYPDLVRHTGHHGFLTDWIALPNAYHLENGGRSALKEIATTWAGSDNTIILSSEEFSRAGGRGGAVDFAELRDIFADFDFMVICVLRDQWQFLQSVYLELSRHAPPPRPPDVVEIALATAQIDGLWCDYNELLACLSQHFAPPEMHWLDYMQARSGTGGLFGAVMHLIVPKAVSAEMLHDSSTANVSPSPIPVWAAHAVAGGSRPIHELSLAAREAFDLEFGPDRASCIFTRQEINRLVTHFGKANERFAKKIEASSAMLVSKLPPPSTIYREDINETYWVRLARRLSIITRQAIVSQPLV